MRLVPGPSASRDGPLVSIVTVVRNGMPHVEGALTSLVQQSYPRIEHVVVDAESTDGTSEIVRQSSPAHYVREPDEGLYDALNKAILHARGDVIGLLHSDDSYEHDNVIGEVADRFARNSGLDMLLTDIVFVDDRDRVVRRYRSNRFSPDRIGWGWMPAHTGLYVTRRFFLDVGFFKPDYSIAADFEWVARAFRRYPVRYEYLPIVSMRMRMGGRSTLGLRASATLNKEVVRACRENGIRTGYGRVLSKYPLKLFDKYV